MRINSGSQSLQMQKAQQALEARRAAKQNAPVQQPAAMPNIQIAKPAAEPVQAATQSVSPQWSRKVSEIQSIAQKVGFVDVSEQDIRRAYKHGESLLADYRV